jgi:acyl-CoA thioesterase-1
MRPLVLMVLSMIFGLCVGPGFAQDLDRDRAHILILGDSIFAWNAQDRASVSAELAWRTGADITDLSTSGAQIFVDDAEAAALGFDILGQYRPGPWDWVVMNGGANDLEDDCGCGVCDVILDDMIARDGLSGRIPDFIHARRAEGVRVLYLGYYQIGIEETSSAQCVDEFDALDARVAALAGTDAGVVFLSAIGLLSTGDLDRDRIHPNPIGSEILAIAIADAMGAVR